MKHDNEPAPPAPVGQVERPVGRLVPERAGGCEQGCNGCDDCTDYDDDYGDGLEQQDRTCRECDGTGGDRWNDGITPCEACDGEGYKWWA